MKVGDAREATGCQVKQGERQRELSKGNPVRLSELLPGQAHRRVTSKIL
jgi:hypothetical protein